MGEYTEKSWYRYFPLAFLIKNPLPLILFFLASLMLSFGFHRKRSDINIFLLSFIGSFFLMLVIFSLNLGYRYMLPVHPFLAVYCSVIIVWLMEKKQKVFWGVFCLLCLWYAGGTLKVHPHYLAYFNEAVGGPDRGSEYLVDSNLDWGQDLKGLKPFMDKNNIDWIYLVYFGQDDPLYRKIRFLPGKEETKCRPGDGLAIEKAFETAVQAYQSGKPGYFAISATYLRGVYLDNPKYFEFLWDKKPVAKIGYSIFIYKMQ